MIWMLVVIADRRIMGVIRRDRRGRRMGAYDDCMPGTPDIRSESGRIARVGLKATGCTR